jgi:hypothetical protein
MTKSQELVDWTFEKLCRKTVKALEKNEFTAVFCQTAGKACQYILDEAADAETIALGGSMSLSEMKIADKLKKMGKTILVSKGAGISPEEGMAIRRRQLTCDLFLCGSNAVTLSGSLVNIDNTGNRVGPMAFGPQKSIVVVGRNKIVDGSIETAIKRIKDRAAPPNAKRLNYDTPCATTGFCNDCASPDRICRIITILEKKPKRSDLRVLVVNQDLGF